MNAVNPWQLVGALALVAIQWWREDATKRAERRRLRKLRQAERRDEARQRKGDA